MAYICTCNDNKSRSHEFKRRKWAEVWDESEKGEDNRPDAITECCMNFSKDKVKF